MDIVKNETGTVLFIENGTVLQNLRPCASIKYAIGNDDYRVFDDTKANSFGFNFSSVESTQVLPNAAVPFLGTREELFMLLVESFFNCTGSAIEPPFNPIDTGGLKIWFDAQDNNTITLNGANEVLQWDDKSGSNLQAFSPIGERPTLDQIQFGGKQSVLFDDAYMDHQPITFTAANWTYFVVLLSIDIPNTTAYFHVGDIKFTNPDVGFYAGGFFNNPVRFNGFGAVNASLPVPIKTLSSIENPMIENEASMRMLYNDSVWKNAVEGTNPLSDVPLTGGDVSRLGSRINVPVERFHGNIGEILAYDVRLSMENRQKTEGYLAWKWNLEGDLPIGHPYKNSPPA